MNKIRYQCPFCDYIGRKSNTFEHHVFKAHGRKVIAKAGIFNLLPEEVITAPVESEEEIAEDIAEFFNDPPPIIEESKESEPEELEPPEPPKPKFKLINLIYPESQEVSGLLLDNYGNLLSHLPGLDNIKKRIESHESLYLDLMTRNKISDEAIGFLQFEIDDRLALPLLMGSDIVKEYLDKTETKDFNEEVKKLTEKLTQPIPQPTTQSKPDYLDPGDDP